MRTRIALTGCAFVACSASQLVLKAPLEDQCSDAGLRGCPELTDGILLYVQGEREEATSKLKSGAAKNAPDELREFAKKIRLLKSIPGVDKYAEPLLEVADLLASEPGGKSSKTAEARSEGTSTDGSKEPGRPKGTAGATVPSADTRSRKCNLYGDASWQANFSTGRCVNIAMGPATLTDLQTTGACRDELAVGAGDPHSPTWVLIAKPSAALSIHGARYVAQEDESLFVIQAGPNVDALSQGIDCVVSWAIERR
jgi:hypothetical protein